MRSRWCSCSSIS